MYCTFCGQENSDNANFCSHCGKPISAEAEYGLVKSNIEKTKTTASLLTFFFGMFGAMDFYAGNYVKGIIKLLLTLTSIGAIATNIWNIVDLFKISNGTYLDANGQTFTGPNNVAKPIAIVSLILNILGFLLIVGMFCFMIYAAMNANYETVPRGNYHAPAPLNYNPI